MRAFIATALLWLTWPHALAAAKSAVPLKFGSVAMEVPAAMHTRLQPLTRYLSNALAQPVSLRLSPNLDAAVDAVVTGEVDIAYLTPIAYVQAHARGGARLIAKTINKGSPRFRLMIVARADGAVHSVADLAGRRFAFGDPAALLQRAVVVNAGMPLRRLGSYAYLNHYDNVVRGVLSGDFDAGIVKDTAAHAWQKKGLRIVYASPDLPPYNVVVSKKVSPELAEKIKGAFLALSPQRPADLRVIQALDATYEGFAPTSDAEYEIVRTLVRPFQRKRAQ